MGNINCTTKNLKQQNISLHSEFAVCGSLFILLITVFTKNMPPDNEAPHCMDDSHMFEVY
jgi:hypothetical protein